MGDHLPTWQESYANIRYTLDRRLTHGEAAAFVAKSGCDIRPPEHRAITQNWFDRFWVIRVTSQKIRVNSKKREKVKKYLTNST